MMHPTKQENIMQSLCTQVRDKLAESIIEIESDEILKQMRNDKTLYELKLSHIKETIGEIFDFSIEMDRIVAENEHLKAHFSTLEQKIATKDHEFEEAINMIEISAKMHTKSKEDEILKMNTVIKELENKLISKSKSDVSQNHKNFEEEKKFIAMEEEKKKLEREVGLAKEEIVKLCEINKKLKMNIKESEKDHEKSILLMKAEHSKEIQELEGLSKKMQNDMLLIKNQWHKKCTEVEKNLREYYEGELIRLEEKKNRDLLQQIEMLKEGKPVIIKQDEEIVASRMESIRRQCDLEVERLGKENEEAREMYERLQSAHLTKSKEVENMSEILKSLRNELEVEKDTWTSEKEKSRREIEKLKTILTELERSHKDTLISTEEKHSEIVKLEDSLKFLEKKLDIANRNLADQKSLIEQKEDDFEILKTKSNNFEENLKKMKKICESHEAEMEVKGKKIESLMKEIESLKENNEEFAKVENSLKIQIKNLKLSKDKLRKSIDKIHIQLKNTQKESCLIKEDIKYLCELQKKKQVSELSKLVEQVETYKENTHKMTKVKMNELINEIEEAKEVEQEELDTVCRERENLKREILELEDLFTKKEKEVEEAKRNIINEQTEQLRREMSQEIQREKLRCDRLQEELDRAEKEHHRILHKTKNEVKDSIKVFATKWTEEILKLEDDNKRKEMEMQRIVDKVQAVIGESEEATRNYESEKEELRKLRKRYDNLKQEKEDQVADLIKKYERESKHKLNLEKELRSIRSELNRGENFNKNYKDYTERERERERERENKIYGNNIMGGTTDREKEITEIRELIAKTYQVVGEKPEKDNKMERKRSPY